ncbi:MAG: lysoplasmalogenase [Ardenticatenaceae bacterium]|nr:lysoplasmalogenase [Ardenticatenaceae bacterium]
MFSFLRTTQQYWLIGLLILWAVFLFGGFIFGSGERRMPTWTRMVSSAVLVIAAWSWFVVNRGNFSLLLALGMTLGFVGDLWLAGVLPFGRSVIGGIVAFGIGHIFYISAILTFANQHKLNAPGARWLALAGWLLIGLIGWYVVVFRGQEVTMLHWAALPYALLLASTAGLATGLALQSSHFVPMALGAALFLLSDLILAGELFSGLQFPLIGDVIWLTYGPGQALIVYAASAVYHFG